MPQPFDETLDLITRRLDVDAELRLEVRREMEGHLDDSKREYLAAGLSDEEATAKAIESMGDKEDRAGQFWVANRSRIKIRSLIRWTLAATIVPLALLASFLPLLMDGSFLDFAQYSASSPFEMSKVKISRLSPDDRLIVDGDPNVRSNRWPDNPVYFAAAFNDRIRPTVIAGILKDPKSASAFFTDIDRGRRLDPDNAYYDFIEAYAWFSMSSELVLEDPNLVYQCVESDGKSPNYLQVTPAKLNGLKISDPNLFAKGMDAFGRAVRKPTFTDRAWDLIAIKDQALSAPKRLFDIFNHFNLQVDELLITINYINRVFGIVTADALAKARSGQAREALNQLRAAEIIANKMGAGSGSRIFIELMVAWSERSLIGTYKGAVLQEARQVDLVRQNFEERRRDVNLWKDVKKTDPLKSAEIESHESLTFARFLGHGLNDMKINLNPAPLRIAEHTVAEQVSVSAQNQPPGSASKPATFRE